MTLNILRYLMYRQFRTYFFLFLGAIFIVQSFLVYYLLYKVKEIEGPFQFGSSELSSLEVASREKEFGYLGKFSCELTSKTAISAVKRATTQKCKEELSQVACNLKNHLLFPEKLPNYCIRKHSSPGSSLGCFHDSNQPRLLSSYGVKMLGLTIQKCIDICVQSAFPYAGVQSGKECYCGTQKPSLEHLLTMSYCSVPCDGSSSQKCGGIDSTEIFDTGVPTRESAALHEPTTHNGSVRIAFILTLNGRALRQVSRLLRLIYRPHHVYLIHVDARQDYLFRSLLKLELSFANIRLMRKRESSIWGGVSLLDVLVRAMRQLLDTAADWDFVFNLSESDFPVRSVESLESLLAANRDRNFLKSHGRQTRQFIHKQGLDRVFHQCEGRMWRVGDRVLPNGIRFDGGSDWFGLTRKFVQLAVADDNALLQGLGQFYRYTLLPAESFFHVLVLNSKFCRTYADDNLRMTLWRRNQGCLCQHRMVVDWCGCSPMVFRTSDWSYLSNAMARRPRIFFARKFEAAIDQSIINRLEELVTNSSVEHRGWDGYWENVYHQADLTPPVNPALLTLAASFARHAVSLVNHDNSDRSCHLRAGSVVSVTSYFRRDHYQGDLFHFDADRIQLEALVKPLEKTTFTSEPRLLSTFQVASDYDPKEQVLRNRIRALGPASKPTACFKWNTSQNVSAPIIQLVWFDPGLRVRAVHSLNMSDTSKIGFQSLDLDTLLARGLWTVMAFHGERKLLSSQFFVIGTDGDDYQLVLEHPSQKKWETYMDVNSTAKKTLLEKSDVEAYIDRVTSEFYSVQDICYVGKPLSCVPPHVASCAETEWSSFSPDPKSVMPEPINS